MTVNLDSLAAEQATLVSEEILRAARTTSTEADFRREVARIIDAATEEVGLQITPRDEYSVARGRVDSLYNRLILEYKRPGVLKRSNKTTANSEIIKKVKEYVDDVAKQQRQEAKRLAAVVTDGFRFLFVRRVGDGWSVDEPVDVNAATTERFLRLLYSLSRHAALIPENLIQDFGPRTLNAQRAVRALHTALTGTEHPLVSNLFEQWRLFFAEATDYKVWAERIEGKKEFRSFVKGMGIDPGAADAPTVFFAIHTYYALLIKLVATLAASRFTDETTSALSELATKQGDDLKQAFRHIEHGGLFREFGFRNFLEGDFFGWYLSVWNEDIEKAVGNLSRTLAEYDPSSLELAPENARDLLKKLYHYLLPKEIRHDLGEYYTPDWLAERLIRQTLGKADLGDARKRVLDPACGSGTFLVILIRFIRERAARLQKDPTETLELILRNVIGIDLNPLAVIASRTNYLLALGDLVKARKGDIDIPVYQADSVLTPSRGKDLFEGNVYPLRTTVGVFRVPAVFAERERMDMLTNALDEAVESDIGVDAFRARLAKLPGLEPDELEAARPSLEELYRKLRQLHRQGLNGVWARIVKNSFAPLFIEACHYVVGNPPWVNWRHLPDEYRWRTMPLWKHYGLFPKREDGLQTILGHTNYDISTLMTVVAIDKYLRHGGKLGFVLSQSLFKTSGAGDGFRQFTLPDKTHFGPLVVEDMVDLHPFEGAANRTSTAILAKGKPVKYPVPYQYWKRRKRGRGSSVGFDTPYEDVTGEKITSQAWVAEPIKRQVLTSAWLTGRPKAIRAVRRIIGQSGYRARIGTYTGGANAVFWIEVIAERPGGLLIVSNVTEGAKKKATQVQAAIETSLVFPLLRGSDVRRWLPETSISILVTHQVGKRLNAIPVETMQRDYPKAYSYLQHFEALLRNRAVFKRYFKPDSPFYSMFDIGDYSFAEWKVVWREQASQMTAAVVRPHSGRPVIPDHKLLMVEVVSRAEAHYLCCVLNSAPVRFAVASYAIKIQMDAHILENVSIPRFQEENLTHQSLSSLSEAASEAAETGSQTELGKIEEEIDRVVAHLWNLTDEDLAEIKRSLKEM